MQGLAQFQMVREHREELLHEAKRRRLVRELRAMRQEERLRLRRYVGTALRALRIKSSSLSAGQIC
jgi:hypothetical protein